MPERLKIVGWLCALISILTACVGTERLATPTLQQGTPVDTATRSPTHIRPTPTVPVPATPRPTATRAKPSPTETAPAPEVTDLRPPLVVDSEGGRLYLTGMIDGEEQIVALDATSGHAVATYAISGTFAVDGLHGWLYVDQGAEGLAVVNLQTAGVHATVVLPPTDRWKEPAPLTDPARGNVLAFRNNEVLFVDPQEGQIVERMVVDVEADPNSCGTRGSALPIQDAIYDAQRRVLHLEFMTYVCTPWSGYTLVSYELDTGEELARRRGSGPTARATAQDGYLFGSSWYRMGFGYRWALHDMQAVAESSNWQGGVIDWILDTNRQRLFETAGRYLRVFDSRTMALQMVVPSPASGPLLGHDPATDQLYFLDDGRLLRYPAAAIRAPEPQPLRATQPPTTAVRSLIVSPSWPQDRTLFGIWDVPVAAGDCWVFGQAHGLLLISPDGGETWQRLPSLEHSCGYVTSLAVSESYEQDGTLLAGLPGLGLWKSTDGGQSWHPSSQGLPSNGISQILLSPAWGQDRTAFVRTVSSTDLFRTKDGGDSWKSLQAVDLRLVDMSMEFDQDRTLVGLAWTSSSLPQPQPNELLLSTDEGEHWDHAGELGASRTASMLSLAPEFAKWQVLFVHGDDGWLYRSENRGAHWVPVLQTSPPEPDPFNTSPRLVYAPAMETQRPLFLLVTQTEYTSAGQAVCGRLFQSDDGGLAWRDVSLPADLNPTAIAISPAFQQDGLLFLGLADGRVVAWPGA